MTDIDKAREWAEDGKGLYSPGSRAKAVTDLILSLPDQWVDAEKVRELVSTFHSKEDVPFTPFVAVMAFKECAEALESLLNQKLPTLADMTQEEREACQWMQADYVPLNEVPERVIIANITTLGAQVMSENFGVSNRDGSRITPLPDLPKLQWPGGEPIEKHGNASLDPQENIDASFKYIKKTTPDQAVAKDVCNSEPNSSETPKSSLPCPEDVPDPHPGEAWLVNTREGEQREALKAGNSWYVKDGDDVEEWVKEALTPISRLVPESHTLPEGMRLADHKTYGRVVVAPRANTHGEESFYRTNDDISWGASHGYRPTGEFNFLDGDQHV